LVRAQAHEPFRVLAAVLFAAIVVFDPRSGHAGGRPKYLLVLVGGLAAAGLLVLAGGLATRWRANPLRWPVATLVGWTVVAALASDHPRTALFGFTGSYDGLLTTLALAALFFVACTLPLQAVVATIRVLWFGAGTVVLLFGLAQLVDRLLSPDSGWDWARPDISPWTIGSTLGNPNHLGALLAMLLPLAAVLAVQARGRERLAITAVAALAVVELGITAARGAWLGLIAATAVLAVLFRRELRPHRRRVALTAVATIAALAAVYLVLGAAGATKIEPADLARAGPGSTLDLRLELWSTAWRVTADHPVAGVGPDVFPLVFPAYASERFFRLHGPFTVANGAHNVFVNTLVNVGAVGLAAFVALLAVAATWFARAWPLLHGESRLVAGTLAAGVVAYLVQACLNVQVVALSLCFWTFLGMLVAVTLAGVSKEVGA
jgi:hypothetical protein